MIIGIDGNEANISNRVGVGEYAYEILWGIYRLDDKKNNYHIYLKDFPQKDLPEQRANWQYIVCGPRKMWTQFGLPLYLFTHWPWPDVFFTPSHYSPRLCPCPTVMSVMDLSYLYFPEMFTKKDLYQLVNWTVYSVKKAKRIFTISQHSKNAIMEKYGISEEKVTVTHLALKMTNQIQNSKLKIQGDYLLYVGTLQPRKNLVKAIEAFHRCKTQSLKFKDTKFVIAGKKGWLYDEIFQKITDLHLENDVIFTGYVADEDLPELYKNAKAFIFVSLYEGFGLPILEAMSYGIPVLASNSSSIPEVAGEAAILVDPNSVDEIAMGMEKLITDEKLRNDLIAKGKEQIKKFSWEKAAKETLKVLEEVASQ